jgi:hypothetical protein
MSARPNVVYGKLELHLRADPDFAVRFGNRIKRVGGSYSNVRGHVRTRYVTVPAGETALIDELARLYSPGPQMTVVARNLSAEGYSNWRIDQAAGRAPDIVFKWRGVDADGPLSEFMRAAFEQKMDAVDWAPSLTRWKAEDDREAARILGQTLGAQISSLQEQIAQEALRIEEGANDIEPLKALARRYREVSQALKGPEGEDEEPSAPGLGL